MPVFPVTHPLALQRLADARLPAPNVFNLAIGIASHIHPTLQPNTIHAQIDRIVMDVQHLLQHESLPHAAMRHVLFERHGFRGNIGHYQDPQNSYIDSVLSRRTGLPILLSMIYVETAKRAGLVAHGIGLPGHFIVALDPNADPTQRLYFDPYHSGKPITVQECYAITLQHGTPWNDAYLTPVDPIPWALRMLTNLRHVYAEMGDTANLAAVLEQTLMLGSPDPALQSQLTTLYTQLNRNLADQN